MTVRIGTKAPNRFYLGDKQNRKLYLGNTLVYAQELSGGGTIANTLTNPPISARAGMMAPDGPRVFVNAFKTASRWDSNGGGDWNALIAAGHVTAGGQVVSIPAGGDPGVWTRVLADLPAASGASGRYRLTWDGTGVIDFYGVSNETQTANSIEFDYTATGGSFVTVVVRSVSAGPLRNFKLVHQDDWAADAAGKLFRQQYLDEIRNWRTIRFDEWAGILTEEPYGLILTNWTSRALPTDEIFLRRFVPYEWMAALCNEIGADMWVCMPTAATDDYIQGAATLIRSLMPAPRHVYTEYSTKTWDFAGTPQAHYCAEQGTAMFGTSGGSEFLNFYGVRSARNAQIWRGVWGADARLHTVVQTQTDWLGNEFDILVAPMWRDGVGNAPSNYVPPHSVIDMLTIHAQVDGGMAYGARASEINTWRTTLTQTEAFNRMRDQMLDGRYFNTTDENQRNILRLTPKWNYYRDIANTYSMGLCCYEVGNHLNGVGADQAFLEAFAVSTQMATVYTTTLAAIRTAGFDGPLAFSVDVRKPDTNSICGLQRWVGDRNPAWTAVNAVNLVNDGPTGRGANDFVGTAENGSAPAVLPLTHASFVGRGITMQGRGDSYMRFISNGTDTRRTATWATPPAGSRVQCTATVTGGTLYFRGDDTDGLDASGITELVPMMNPGTYNIDVVLSLNPTTSPRFGFLAQTIPTTVEITNWRVTVPPVMPAFTTQPSAVPANANVGDNVMLTLGAATNATALTGVLMQGGVDRSAEVLDGQWSPGVAGAYTWTVTATGPGGSAVATAVGGTIAAVQTPSEVIAGLSNVIGLWDAGTLADGAVTSVAPTFGSINLVRAGVAGNPITKGAEGGRAAISFGTGTRLNAAGSGVVAGDPLTVILTFYISDVSTDFQNIFGPSSAYQAIFRSSAGPITPGVQVSATGGSATGMGSVSVGWHTLEFYQNQTNLRVIVDGGDVRTIPQAGAGNPNLFFGTNNSTTAVTGIRIGKIFVAKADFFDTPGSRAVKEYMGGFQSSQLPATVEIMAARGQSLAMGPGMGGQAAPNGSLWRDVLSANPGVYMMAGAYRGDGVLVANIANPLKAGYDATRPVSGHTPMRVQTTVPESAILANGVVRDGIAPAVFTHFNDWGGLSVEQLDDDPATGSGGDAALITAYQNAEFAISESARVIRAAGSTPVMSRIVYNQGEADVSRERGWWLAAFRKTWGQMTAQAQRLTGQASAPRLFLHQTGGYMYGSSTNLHQCKLDQLDAVVEHNGILIGPLYPYAVNNSDGKGVHLTPEAYLEAYEVAVWSIAETAAGRAWNILPPTATRSGSTITLTFNLRSDENLLAHASGKYSPYGGDPENYGLDAVGGGAITGVTVGANSLTLTTSGTVTGIRYAMQRTPTDYRTLTVDGIGHIAHRGLLRTSLTKAVTLGGLSLTLRRWLPSFEVAVT